MAKELTQQLQEGWPEIQSAMAELDEMMGESIECSFGLYSEPSGLLLLAYD